ncbi:hypothetical protein KSX_42080 [Ktedonospora formicarum]|uniref:Uncharacterized protein n=1 Tax=Ktedonospora formicarum TaxID=2778364 RepID=A0A8J3MSF0_9CHLR|nr:hypothetical protein KSX_42080 [Ktedonospora formicarum]
MTRQTSLFFQFFDAHRKVLQKRLDYKLRSIVYTRGIEEARTFEKDTGLSNSRRGGEKEELSL